MVEATPLGTASPRLSGAPGAESSPSSHARHWPAAGAVGTTAFGHQVQVSYYSGTNATPSPTNPDRYVNRPVLRATPKVDPITLAACRPYVASQRRRNLQRA